MEAEETTRLLLDLALDMMREEAEWREAQQAIGGERDCLALDTVLEQPNERGVT